MKKLLVLLFFTTQLISATIQDHRIAQHLTEQEIEYYQELMRAGVSTRYPSVINYLYEVTKEGFRDIHEGLWNVADLFADYLLPDHIFNNKPAFVRYAPNNELCAAERAFINNRLPHAREALEKFLETKLDENSMPRIALCFSGGGFRAMNLTLGFLKGAHDTGLFESSMYMCGLSGSTWAIAPWIATNEPLDVYMNELSKKIEQGLNHLNSPQEIELLMQKLLVKTLHKQPLSSIDLYGAVLANTLLSDFGDGRMNLTISESHQDVLMGFLPMPIYTSIQTNKTPYEWMECTPFEIGSDHLLSYIPTWAYGRKFQHGASLDSAPEQSLGYFLGIFGSAFNVCFQDILVHAGDKLQGLKLKLPPLLQEPAHKMINFIGASPLNNLRLFPSMLRNFTHNVQWSPLCNDKNICLVDAGIDFNIPFPPLLRAERKVDVIIVYDASGTIQGSTELKNAELYAKRKGLKFPRIDYALADKNIVSVFKDKDPKVPVVIYFPRITNPAYSQFDPDYCTQHSYCNTMNFNYSQEQFKELSGLAEFTVKQHTTLIKDVLNEVVQKKKG
ncbi:MAG: hypothetical protein AB7F19_06960 [Candidatus Babeliales bacterium]